MGWFDKIRKDFSIGEDSIYVRNYVEAFIINEQQFTHVFYSVDQDLSKIKNYYQQFEMMQGIIDKLIEYLDKHENNNRLPDFLSLYITVQPFGKITVQQAYKEIQESIQRIHLLIGQEYFKC